MERLPRNILLLLVFFALLFALRLVHLDADPPDDWTRASLGYMSDPGGYVHNARNKVLFGRWETDNWNHMYTSPIPHFLTYIAFKIFDPGIGPMNAVPACFSCLLLVFFFLILKNTYGWTYAWLGTLLLGVNYIFTAFSQVAVRAIPMVFFVVLALYFLTRRKIPGKWDLILAGALCFLAFTAKGTLLLILPAVGLGVVAFFFFQNSLRFGPALGAGLFMLLGLMLVMGVWLVLIYFPHIEAFQDFTASNFFWLTHGSEHFLQVFWMRPLFFFMDMPVVTVLSSLALLALAYKAFSSPWELSLLSWVSGFWVTSNMVYYSLIYYRAARHFTPLIVPMVLLAVGLLHDFEKGSGLQRPRKKPILFFGFLFVWQIYAFSSLFILFSRPLSQQLWPSRFLHVLVLAAVSTVVVYGLLWLWPRKFSLFPPSGVRIALISFLILFSVVFNLQSWWQWARAPRFDRKEISQDLGQAFHHIRIGGLVSMVMCLENTHAAHAYKSGYINKGLDFLDRYRITHALLSTHAEEVSDYFKDFPRVMAQARILARYPIWHTNLVLYDLYPASAAADPGKKTWEGETFFGENGKPRYDRDASGKLAFAAERHPQGSFLKLPLEILPPGEYRIIYRLKIANPGMGGDRIARLDVTSEERSRAYVQKDVLGSDFSESGRYQDFELDLTLKEDRQLTLRLFATGKTQLWFDSVTLIKKNPNLKSLRVLMGNNG